MSLTNTAFKRSFRHACAPANWTTGAHRVRVLVIEDEAAIALDIVSMLCAANYDVVSLCYDVPSALAAIVRGGIDAVVLDLKLGRTDSYRVADRLDDLAIPFVWVSGFDQMTLPARHRKSPFLAKPFTHQQFLAAVRAVYPVAPQDTATAV